MSWRRELRNEPPTSSRATEELQAEIVERKRGEEALRERANLLDLTHDPVFVRDHSDVITFWNHGAENLYGWTKDESVGQVSHHLMQTIFPAPLEEITAALNSTGRWEAELIQTRRDGTQVAVTSRWALQLDDQGKPIAILETNNDITERKRAEEALGKARAELAHVTRVTTLGEMTASIAHEINQPLAAVINNASACLRWLAANHLEEARPSWRADPRRWPSSTAKSSAGCARSLRNLLRGRTGSTSTKPYLKCPPWRAAKSKRIAWHYKLNSRDDVPLILEDPIQLQQVILNLIINAIEAMSGVRTGHESYWSAPGNMNHMGCWSRCEIRAWGSPPRVSIISSRRLYHQA